MTDRKWCFNINSISSTKIKWNLLKTSNNFLNTRKSLNLLTSPLATKVQNYQLLTFTSPAQSNWNQISNKPTHIRKLLDKNHSSLSPHLVHTCDRCCPIYTTYQPTHHPPASEQDVGLLHLRRKICVRGWQGCPCKDDVSGARLYIIDPDASLSRFPFV